MESAEFEHQDDDELFNTSTRTSPDSPATTGVHGSPVEPSTSSSSAANRAGGRRLTSVIMMYSPYIPSIDEQNDPTIANSSRSADIGNYYSRIDTEETVKCVVTSVLFCAVIALIILVAVFINPGM